MSTSEDLRKTIEKYRELVQQNPDNTDILTSLAWSYSQIGDYDQAIQQFEQILHLDRQNSDAYYGLGLAYKAIGYADKALDAFSKAHELIGQEDDRGRMLIGSQQIEVYMRRLEADAS